MDENSLFNLAEEKFANGHTDEATKILLSIFNTTRNAVMKVNCGLQLNRVSETSKNYEQLIVVCDECLNIIDTLKDDSAKSLLLAYKGQLHLFACFINKNRMIRLKMHLGWIGFSLALDQEDYENSSEESEKNEKEFLECSALAISLVDKTNDRQAISVVYSVVAQSFGQKYFDIQLKIFKKKFYIFLKHLGIESVLYSKKDRSEIKNYLTKAEKYFARAIGICGEQKDCQEYKSLAIYNYANFLRMINKFKKANKQINKVKEMAENKIMR